MLIGGDVGGGDIQTRRAPSRGGGASGMPQIMRRLKAQKRGQTAPTASPYDGGMGEGMVTESRNRFMESMSVTPESLAEGAMGFYQDAAGGFARDLMPDLERGLGAARSRFSGGGGDGSIRSGGAQQAEEYAFERLFSNPMQNKIAQLSEGALAYGQSEAQRGVSNAGSMLDFDDNRFMGRMDRADTNKRYFAGLDEEKRQFDASRQDKKRAGVGKLFGTVAGGAAGFLIGGPAGAFTGAKIGSNLG